MGGGLAPTFPAAAVYFADFVTVAAARADVTAAVVLTARHLVHQHVVAVTQLLGDV